MKKNKVLFFGASILLFIILLILAVIWIQREVRWGETKHEMEIMEHEILQKIKLTEEEYMPPEMMQELYDVIMTESEELINPIYQRCTEEFLRRINSSMNLDLKQEDLISARYSTKKDLDELEKYGKSEKDLVYYEFLIGNSEFSYQYSFGLGLGYSVLKSISQGELNYNKVLVMNKDNKWITTLGWPWVMNTNTVENIFMEDLDKFMQMWNEGRIPNDCKYITVKNIQKYEFYISHNYYK